MAWAAPGLLVPCPSGGPLEAAGNCRCREMIAALHRLCRCKVQDSAYRLGQAPLRSRIVVMEGLSNEQITRGSLTVLLEP